MSETDEDLTPAEGESLAALRRDLQPSDALEREVLGKLKSLGLVEERGQAPLRWLRPVLLLAAAAGLFVAGLLAGGRSFRAETPSTSLPRYVLFLEGSGPEPPPPEEARRVQAYKQWARRIAGEGHLISGEKLSAQATRLGGGSPAAGGESVQGYFVIAAADDAQALAIARGCPHLLYGGWIVLRQIDPV